MCEKETFTTLSGLPAWLKQSFPLASPHFCLKSTSVTLLEVRTKPMLSEQLLKTFPLRQPCNETSPVTSSLCLMSTPDALLEVMGQRYRKVYNQQAEKQMSEQSDGPAIRVCWMNGETTGQSFARHNQQGNCASDGVTLQFCLAEWNAKKGKECQFGDKPHFA